MEAPKAYEVKKTEKTIELSLKSDDNIPYDVSIYYILDKLYLKATSKDMFNKKKYSSEYTIDQIKENKFFNLHETIEEIYEELDSIIKNTKSKDEIIILEETNKIILRIPLPSIKIKECLFQINEEALNMEQNFAEVFIKLSQIQKTDLERYNSLKEGNKEINQLNNSIKELVIELKEKNDELKRQNGELKVQNKELKEQNDNIVNNISELKSQNDELKNQNNNLKEQIIEIKNLCNFIKEQINIMSSKSDEIKTEIINELKNDNKINCEQLTEKIKYIYDYAQKKKNEDRICKQKMDEQKEKEYELIKSWINSTLDSRQKIELQLIYKKSRDGDSISNFHRRCDGRGKTVTIIETKDGLKFGGFKNDSWDCNGWKKNNKDFVFSLNTLTKYNHNNNGDSTYGHYDYVCFGNSSTGGDICFHKSMNIGYNGSCSFGTGQMLNMKKGYFEALEVEVYKAIF